MNELYNHSVSGESGPPGNMQSAGERGHQACAGEDIRAQDQVQVQCWPEIEQKIGKLGRLRNYHEGMGSFKNLC